MGFWWKKLPMTPHRIIPWVRTVKFSGDKSAMSRSVPFFWRMFQDWHCLQVAQLPDSEFDAGYYIYFTGKDEQVTRYRQLLRTRFVMVREGRERVNFWVEDAHGNVGELIKTGVMVPGNRFRRDLTPDGKSLKKLLTIGSVSWI